MAHFQHIAAKRRRDFRGLWSGPLCVEGPASWRALWGSPVCVQLSAGAAFGLTGAFLCVDDAQVVTSWALGPGIICEETAG